ncbi:MAG: InlB B-repeat-containing protein [Clostridia bacterium]|nr:InlB B-repeat-containing protein [Clostridia bacterium]
MKNKRKSFLRALAIGCMSLIAAASISLFGVSPLKMDSVVGSAAGSNSFVAPRTVYVTTDGSGYKLNNEGATDSLPVGGTTSYTEVSVNASSGSIVKGTNGNYTAYGVTGSSVSISLKFKMGHDLGGGEWYLGSDSYGGTDGDTVMGISSPGKIESGMLIVRTSYDAKTWNKLGSKQYAGGLNTTNFSKDRKAGDVVEIYCPDGKDIQKGVYVEVDYLYEIVDHWQTEHYEWYKRLLFGIKLGTPTMVDNYAYKNVIETSTFYIVSDEPSAVTFHNLSAKDSKELKGEDGESIDYLTRSETLTNNSVTSKGFQIDQTLLPSSTVSVTRNGSAFNIPSDKKITQDGCYDVTVKTKLGKTKTTRIYVDTRDFEEMKAYHFGEGLLAGSKRIYDRGELPVYEGGLTNYALQAVGKEYLPLFGYVKNLTTGTVIEIANTREAKSGTLTEAGEYEVVLLNNPTFNTTNPVGDCKTITFKFKLIENGTAPGPMENKKLLAQYMQSNVSDLKPFFYAVTQRSAGRGDITIAFSSYQNAYDYAYAQNVGLVEETSNGCYRYFGHFVTQSKEKYESGFDLTAALNYFTEQSVTVNYFDLSEEDGFSYTTLEDGLLDGRNLRALELSASVVVFASEEDRIALLQNAEIPLIALKKSAALKDGIDAEVQQEVEDFVFLRDSLGIDSEQVSVLDGNGKAYKIEYGKGFAQQLIDYNLPTGRYIVVESTIYGDVTSYPIRFIAPDDNTATVTMSYRYNGELFEEQFDQTATQEEITVEANEFTLSLVDDMDISYVKVRKYGSFEDGCTAEDLDGLSFHEEGEYRIIVVNTLGYTFSFNVTVTKFVPVTINFSEGEIEGIDTYYSATNVLLPQMEKYGYNFKGYVDDEGNQYNEQISEVLFIRDVILKPVWEAKKYFLSLHYTDSEVETEEVEFGTETELPDVKAPKDHRFVGWYDEETGEYVREKFMLSAERNVTLQAKLVKTHSSVTFDLGVEKHESKYEVGSTFLLPQMINREGYIFQGWLINGQAYEAAAYIVGEKDCTFEAIWSEKPAEEQPQAEEPTQDKEEVIQEPTEEIVEETVEEKVPAVENEALQEEAAAPAETETEETAESGCSASLNLNGGLFIIVTIGGVCCMKIFNKRKENK